MLGSISTIISIFKDLFKGVELIRKFLIRKEKPNEPMTGPSSEDEVNALIERFVLIFKAHGIERAQLPWFLAKDINLTLNDVSTNKKLLRVLDKDILNKTCENFGVRREWLDGKDVPIYPYRYFDKNLGAFIDFLTELKRDFQEVQGHAIKSPEDRLLKDEERLNIALCFRARIDHWGHFSEESIWKCFPLLDTFYWGYERTRLELKAMLLIAWQFGIHICGCQWPQKDIDALITGTIFPGPLFEYQTWTAWHPEDYIFAQGESLAVKDSDEALLAREYMQGEWLNKLVSLTGPIKKPLINGLPSNAELKARLSGSKQ